MTWEGSFPALGRFLFCRMGRHRPLFFLPSFSTALSTQHSASLPSAEGRTTSCATPADGRLCSEGPWLLSFLSFLSTEHHQSQALGSPDGLWDCRLSNHPSAHLLGREREHCFTPVRTSEALRPLGSHHGGKPWLCYISGHPLSLSFNLFPLPCISCCHLSL